MSENTPPPADGDPTAAGGSAEPPETAPQPAAESAPPPPAAPAPDAPPPPVDSPPPAAPPPAYGQPPQPGYGQPVYQQAPPAGLSPADERTWGAAAHWSSYVASLVGLSFLGPLVVMLTQGNKSAFVRQHAVESLNFQLSLLIYAIVSGVLILVLVGIFLLIAVGLMWLVFPILATIKASAGEPYRYPLTIRMVS